MDRFDEAKHVPTDDSDMDRTAPEGDVLGIARSPVPKSPEDPTASDDPESIRHRRQRALGEDDETQLSDRPARTPSGATGIDMGSGGSGTDLSGE